MARRDLIERLNLVVPETYRGVLYRSTSPGYDVLSGEGARVKGGRWNPPGSFPCIYTATDPSGAALEVYRTARKFGVAVETLLPRHLTTLRAKLGRVLNLCTPTSLEALGLNGAVLTDDDLRICQAVGDAAHYLGFEGILAPSAAGPAATVAIFPNSLRSSSSISIAGTELFDADSVT